MPDRMPGAYAFACGPAARPAQTRAHTKKSPACRMPANGGLRATEAYLLVLPARRGTVVLHDLLGGDDLFEHAGGVAEVRR